MLGAPVSPQELELSELKKDRNVLVGQLRAAQLEVDAVRGQLKNRDDEIKARQDEKISLMAMRDTWKIRFDVCKQILDDLHKQLIGGTHGEDRC